MDDEERSVNRQQVRRQIVVQDVRPPAVRVTSPNLWTQRIGLDFRKFGVGLGADLRRNSELEGLAEGPARRGGEDDGRCRRDAWSEHRYRRPALRTAEQDDSAVRPRRRLHLPQDAFVVGSAFAYSVSRIQRRGAVPQRILRLIM